jgi:hypothetical protein
MLAENVVDAVEKVLPWQPGKADPDNGRPTSLVDRPSRIPNPQS